MSGQIEQTFRSVIPSDIREYVLRRKGEKATHRAIQQELESRQLHISIGSITNIANGKCYVKL